MVILSRIEQHALLCPDKVAVQVGDLSRTYAELADRARSFSTFLKSLQGDRSGRQHLRSVGKLVALDVGNHLEFAELFAASTQWPFACAVLDCKMKRPQIEKILSRLEPDVVVAEDDGEIARVALELNLRVLKLSELASLIPRPAERHATKTVNPTDGTFLVTFTSGTTSEPKAIVRSRSSWRRSFDRSTEYFRLNERTVTFCPGSLVHGLAMYALMESLYVGGLFKTLEKWSPELSVAAIRSGSVDRIVAVPTMLTALAAKVAAGEPLTAVKAVLTAGEKFGRNHLAHATRIFPDATIQEYYGASELGFITVSKLHPSDGADMIEGVGKPFPGVEISILDPQKNDVESGRPGTIFVKSDLVSDGYLWGDDGGAFRANGARSTVGDIGRMLPGGILQVMGREGGMITTGGYNVYPTEIESALRTIPGMQETMVFGIPDSYLGAKLVAVYLSDTLEETEVRNKAFDLLPRYKCPREYYRIKSWPLTPSGKIARALVENDVINGEYERI